MLKNILSLIKNIKFLYILLLCVNLCVIVYHFSNKKTFHVDEQWSYAHANSNNGAFLDKDIDSFFKLTDNIRNRLFNQKIEGRIFHNYLTVQKEDIFTYNNIDKNLAKDVHPPLYHILLHTISSFYPDTFSKWFAGSLNLVFFVFLYIAVYKLAKLTFKDERLALLTVAFYGFSKISIDMVIFLRMYTLQTLCGVCLMYQSLKILENNRATKKDLFLVFLYSFLGIFTQYSSIFFSLVVSIVTCLISLKRKQYKLMFYYGTAIFLSVCILFIVFPNSYDVLINSSHSVGILNRMKQNSRDLMPFLSLIDDKNKIFFKTIFSHLFNFDSINISIITFSVIMMIFCIFYFKIKLQTTTICMIIIILLYAFYLIYMPYMFDYTSRYYMLIMPFIAILSISGINYVLYSMKLKDNYRFIILAILIFINSYFYVYNKKSVYSFTLTKSEIQTLNKIKNKTIFLNTPNIITWVHSLSYILKDAKEVFIFDNICDESAIKLVNNTENYFIITHRTFPGLPFQDNTIQCFDDSIFANKSNFCAGIFCYNIFEK